MTENRRDKQQKIYYIGSGIALGAAIGMLLGLLFMDGNISLGLIFGACIGLVFGLLLDVLGGKIVYSLAGLGIGALLGLIFGALLGVLVGPPAAPGSAGVIFGLPISTGYGFIGAVSLAALGLGGGTLIGVNKMQQENQ
jgi:hypothetical protein